MDESTLRLAGPDDTDAIADVYLALFRATYAFPLAHTGDQVRAWIRDVVVPASETWVGVSPDGLIVAVMALTADQVDKLYVAPGWTGRGIGGRLLDLVKAMRSHGLDLYTFQVNAGARRFYERHGFVAVTFGDGSGNEEGEPDVRYAWQPTA